MVLTKREHGKRYWCPNGCGKSVCNSGFNGYNSEYVCTRCNKQFRRKVLINN